jgi:hypothetical protein
MAAIKKKKKRKGWQDGELEPCALLIMKSSMVALEQVNVELQLLST